MEDLSHYNPEGSDLRRAQMRMLEILDVFADICKRHNITYWIACGTLLGAWRHGGFIPWDDDLDIVVLQRDYDKLLSILKAELPENFKLQARGIDKNYWHYWTKIRDTNSRVNPKKPRDYEHMGLFIDVFSIEPVPSMEFKKVIDKFLFSEIHFKTAKSIYHKIKYRLMLSLMPVTRFVIKLSRVFYKYVKSKNYAYSYGVFVYSSYNIENFFPVSEIIFEGKKYNAPGNIDLYLTDNFGPDFMQIPKAADRLNHTSTIEFF